MYRLCYISTSREPVTEALCNDILAVSRPNNERDGITGLLLAGKRRFLQALEGEEQAVKRAFHRIRGDARHFGCVVIEQGPAEERQFCGWAMGFERSDEGAATLSDPQLAAAMIGQIADRNLRAQFEGFLTLQWRGDRAA